MKHIKRINELLRTPGFNNVTYTPYLNSDPKSPANSRFTEYSTRYPMGWMLVAMQPMDESFNDVGSAIQISKFVQETNSDINLLKESLTCALGELGRQSWIDDFEMPSIKFFAAIYLGKLGFKIKGKYYSPRLIYQDMPKSGNTFWIGANSHKIRKETPDSKDPLFTDNYDNSIINQSAKSISIFPDDYSDADIANMSRIRINGAKKKSWELLQAERKANNLPPLKTKYRQYDDLEFREMFIVIRDPRVKTEFVIYNDDDKSGTTIEFVKNSIVGGKMVGARTTKDEIEKDGARERMDHGKYFSLSPKDPKLEIFQYLNTDPNIPALNLNKYTTVKLIKGSIRPTKPGQTDFREVTVETVTGPKPQTKLSLKIKAGDKMVIPVLSRGRSAKEEVLKKKVIAGKTPTEPTLNKERITIIPDEN